MSATEKWVRGQIFVGKGSVVASDIPFGMEPQEKSDGSGQWVIAITHCGQKFFDKLSIDVTDGDWPHYHARCVICEEVFCTNGHCGQRRRT